MIGICGKDIRCLSDNTGETCFALGGSYCRQVSRGDFGIPAMSELMHHAAQPQPGYPQNNNDQTNRKSHNLESDNQDDHNLGYNSDDNYSRTNDYEAAAQDPDDLGPIEDHDFALDLIDYGAHQDAKEGNRYDSGDGFMIQTIAQTDEVLTATLQAEREIASAPLHVILNRQGHCLIRRNAKLRMVRQHRTFFQKVVARCKNRTIPLVYAEGALFPDVFYYSTSGGAILGALPTALWTDCRTLAKYGIASMRSHACQRLQDGALLTSTDSRYHFLEMDNLVNLNLRGQDTRLVLHRGFAERQSPNEGVTWRQQEGTEELYQDNVENHSNVHKLSCLIDEKDCRLVLHPKLQSKNLSRPWCTSQMD